MGKISQKKENKKSVTLAAISGAEMMAFLKQDKL